MISESENPEITSIVQEMTKHFSETPKIVEQETREQRLMREDPEKYLIEHEERLRLEYAKVRRAQLVKKSQNISIEDVVEKSSKEWTSLQPS